MVLTYRTSDLDVAAPQGWLGRLRRVPGVSFIELKPLTMADAAIQIRGFAGPNVSRIDVAKVFERSEGNPFFIEQLVESLLDDESSTERGAPPAGLTAVLLARIEQVDGLAREVLACMAVAGRPVDERVIAECCSASVPDVRLALHDLARRFLLRAGTSGSRPWLAHALLAEAITVSMLPGELRDWHLRIAEMLIRHSESGAAGAIAEHFRAAGQDDEELRWRIAAAQYADTIFASAEAADHWFRALELSESAPPSLLPAVAALSEMYISACRDLKLAGRLAEAIVLAERAFERLGGTDDPRTRARLLGNLGYRGSASIQAGRAVLEQAVEVWDKLPPDVGAIEAASDLWMYSHPFADSRRAVERLDEALGLADQLGLAARHQVSLLERRAWADVAQGNAESAMARLAMARALLVNNDDPHEQLMLALWHTDILLKLGRPEEVSAATEPVGLPDWAASGRKEREGSSAVRATVFKALALIGEPETAAPLIDPVTDSEITRDNWLTHAARATLDMHRGSIHASEARWRALPPINHPMAEWDFEPRRAELDLWLRQPQQALDQILAVLEALGTARDSRRSGQLLLIGSRAFADLMEEPNADKRAKARRGSRKIARDVESFHVQMPEDPFALGPLRPTGDADGLLWQAELGRSGGSNDPLPWQETAEAYERYGRPHPAAYARWRQAENLVIDRRTFDEASAVLRSAARQAHQHAPLLAAISRLAARARISLDDLNPPQSTPGFPTHSASPHES
jgi:hypothetical protein